MFAEVEERERWGDMVERGVIAAGLDSFAVDTMYSTCTFVERQEPPMVRGWARDGIRRKCERTILVLPGAGKTVQVAL